MNTFLTTLRQDLIAIRWALPTWIGITLFLVLLPTDLARASFTNVRDYAHLFAIISWVVLICVLFARIALGHSPVDARNGWRTRPLLPGVIALEKLLLASAVFLIPILMGNWASNITPAITIPFLVLLGLLFIASLVPTPRALVAAFLIVGVLLLSSLSFLFNRLSPYYAFALSDTGVLVARLLYVIGFLVLLVRQYIHPNSVVHGCAGVGVIVLVLCTGLVFPDQARPPTMLERPELHLHLQSASPVTDAEFESAAYFNDLDRRFAERSGQLRSHRNWSAHLELSGLREGELWFVRDVNTRTAGRAGLGHRSRNPPRFVPADLLPSRIGLNAGYTWVPSSGNRFSHAFQWVRFDGTDDFPTTPNPADFQVHLLRVRTPEIYAQGAPLAVGDYGLRLPDGSRALSIRTVDYDAGEFEAVIVSRSFAVPDPVVLNRRYTALTLVVFNPQTREAGLGEKVPLASFRDERNQADAHTPQRYRLPSLSGDPHDWKLTLFMAEADGQVILSGTEPVAP